MVLDRESLLNEPVSSYARRESYLSQAMEVHFFEFRMDLYTFSTTRNLTMAVELKLKNWRRAIQQALLYQLCSDLVCIALPQVNIPRIDLDLLRQSGIGLLGVLDLDRCVEILPPRQSSVVRPHYRNAYIDLLQEGST